MTAKRRKSEPLTDDLWDSAGKRFARLPVSVQRICHMPAFAERLSNIQQLGLMSRLLPRCSHTRLDHSIGCALVCDMALDALEDKLAALSIRLTADLRDAVVTAALLHDIGHYPLSHATERAMRGCECVFRPHKYLSLAAAVSLCKSLSYPPDKQTRVRWLLGDSTIDPAAAHQLGLRTYQRQLISSALDVDRIDYVVRDSLTIEMTPLTADQLVGLVKEILNALDVWEALPLEGGADAILVLGETGLTPACRFLLIRHLLYAYGYFHEELRALEGVYTALLVLLDKERPLEGDMGVKNGTEMLPDFFRSQNDQTFLDWIFGAYEARAKPAWRSTRAEAFCKEAIGILGAPEDSTERKGFQRIPVSVDFARVSPVYERQLRAWESWHAVFELLNTALENDGKRWVVIPDILGEEEDEAERFFVRTESDTLYRLSRQTAKMARHLRARLSRVDFYCSPGYGDLDAITGWLRAFLEDRIYQ